MNDHPSVSETFVVTEAAAVRAAGVSVVGYALKPGAAGKPAAPIDLICHPPTVWRLGIMAARAPRIYWRVLRAARRHHISLKETTRLLLAEVHAEYAWRYLKESGVKHVHAHFLGRTADVAQALSQRLGCRWSATAHAADAYSPSEPALFKRRLGSASGIACANHRVEDAVAAQRPPTGVRTCVIRCGVDIPKLQSLRRRNGAEARHVMTIGRLVATKGHWTILEAAEQALTRDKSLRWTIIGGGELYEALRHDDRYLSLYPRLKLAGPMDHETALLQLARAALFVLPCEPGTRGDDDGIPVALMEAMALEVPVITTHVGGISELVSDRVNGFIVKPRDSKSLVAALNDALYDMDEHKLWEMQRAGAAKVESEFSAAREAVKLIEFLSQTTDSDNGVMRLPSAAPR
jgi:colanic acid/amylovoran biosynthesis glycosyltransferase